jgi:enoyl-CoA hydratase/carnithine racemase
MADSSDIITRILGAIGFIELDRPERANAYTDATLAAVENALTDYLRAPEVRLIAVGSAVAGVFCAGADLEELGTRDAAAALKLFSLEVFDRLAAAAKPTIAVVDGPAVAGGLELALACDLRIASPGARFAMPEPTLGLIPAAGATFRLPRVVGESTARQMILFGAELDAAQALARGLVHEVVESARLQDRVEWWAGRVSERDPLALELAKRAIASALADGGSRDVTASAQALLYQRRHQGGDEVP